MRPLQVLLNLQQGYGCHVVYCGDVFDRWNAPAELINFAIDYLPGGYAVPGQHDLPNHSYSRKGESAYWTLVRAGVLVDLRPGKVRTVVGKQGVDLHLHGFPWGTEAVGIEGAENRKNGRHVAVVHDYCWREGHTFPGADVQKHAAAHSFRLKGFDAAFFGDNHVGFTGVFKGPKYPVITNCGGFMRRRTDERMYQPRVWLYKVDGTVEPVPLGTVDRFTDLDDADPKDEDVALHYIHEFVKDLDGLGDQALDFADTVLRVLDRPDVRDGVKDVIRKALEARHGRA